MVACIGPSISGTTLAIMPTFEQAGIPLISCAASIKITQPVQKFIFSTAQPDTLAVAKLMDYLKSQGYKKLAVLSDSNAFGQSGLKALEDQAPKNGMTIAVKETFGSKDPSMQTQLTKIKGRQPRRDHLLGHQSRPGDRGQERQGTQDHHAAVHEPRRLQLKVR